MDRSRGPHRVAEVMGTVISIDVRDPGIPESVVDAMLARLEEIEARFSTYRPESEISRIARGELVESDASAEMRFVLGMCDDLHRTTGGWLVIGGPARTTMLTGAEVVTKPPLSLATAVRE